MVACTDYITRITPDECVGDSLAKINSNFSNIETVTHELEARVNTLKQIRTFFYYGPNAGTDASSGLNNNETSRPSDLTIQAFVNSPSQLNLLAISSPGDVAYVIYQKTGFNSSLATGIPAEYNWSSSTNSWTTTNETGATTSGPTLGVQAVVLPNGKAYGFTHTVGSGGGVTTTTTTTTVKTDYNVTEDIINSFSPAIIIWRLTYTDTQYTVDINFPKFTRAETLNTSGSWNDPTSWSLF